MENSQDDMASLMRWSVNEILLGAGANVRGPVAAA